MTSPGRQRLVPRLIVAGCATVLLAGCGARTVDSDVLVSDLETRMPWEAHPPAATPVADDPAAGDPAAAPGATPTSDTGDSAGAGAGEDADAPESTPGPTDEAGSDVSADDDTGDTDERDGDEDADPGDDAEESDRDETEPPSPEPGNTGGLTDLEAEVVALTDQIRSENGCRSTLSVDEALIAASRAHSSDMAEREYFDHTSPDGEGPAARADDAGYDAWGGENIAFGYSTAQSVMDAWMDSSGHRANILNCGFVVIGVGVTEEDGALYWTQSFGWE